MNVSLNRLWTNTNNYIKTKITESLTPLEKKVALIAPLFLLWRLLVIFSIDSL